MRASPPDNVSLSHNLTKILEENKPNISKILKKYNCFCRKRKLEDSTGYGGKKKKSILPVGINDFFF